MSINNVVVATEAGVKSPGHAKLLLMETHKVP